MARSLQRIEDLKDFLDNKSDLYNRPGFIENDPVSIPHLFTNIQDIEISGLLAAVLAWGQRTTIIRSCHTLLEKMDYAPADFIQHHRAADLKKLVGFKHRTFNATDLLYFVSFLAFYYKRHKSMEDLFLIEQTRLPGGPAGSRGL